ncbi:hypothetical protein [Fluviispira multicolorata]|uniref:Lipoprotein n=1 Tax=Fluviispira multicolorata TaxID=2654512 RepID=A0A833N5L5_9BACT|nr:hypothetical protein [Fluviispira multicolorata]KAB8033519.1 hypothetical protein GCL57_02100 [Fluviispira multicolorata]
MFFKILLKVTLFILFILSTACTKQSSVDFIVENPEMLKKDKYASFYGVEAMKDCQIYRKIYSGFCDTTSQPFVKCFDINDKKYKSTSCE